jgi:hypothetical protein
MLRVAVTFLLACVLVSVISAARSETALFRAVITLDTGQLLVVEESDLEPRSIGSFAVRLYSGANPEFPYDDFQRGLFLKRDGVLESVRELPPQDGHARVLITVRSVGTGGYPSYHLLTLSGDRIRADSYRSELTIPGVDLEQQPEAE